MDSQLLKKFFSSASVVLLARLMAFGSVFAFTALLARALSPADFGIFLLLFSFTSLACLLGNFGLNRALVKRIAESREQQTGWSSSRLVSFGLKIGTLGGVVVGVIAGLLVWKFLPVDGSGGGSVSSATTSASTIALAFAAIICLRSIHLVAAESFRGFHEKYWSNFFGGPAGGPLPHLFFVILILIGRESVTLEWSLQAYIVAFATPLPFLIWRLRNVATQQSHATPLDVEAGKVSELMTLAWPLMLTQVFGLALSQADIWLAGMLAAPAALAIYGASQRMLAFLTIPLQITNTAIVSYIPQLIAQKNQKGLQSIVGMAATTSALPAIIVSVLYFVFAESILWLAFGEYYMQGAMILRILTVGQLICVLTGPCEVLLMMAGHQKTTLKVNAVAAVGILVVGPLAIWQFGMIGLAVAISCSTATQNLVNWYLAYRKLGIKTNVGAIPLSVSEIAKSLKLNLGRRNCVTKA